MVVSSKDATFPGQYRWSDGLLLSLVAGLWSRERFRPVFGGELRGRRCTEQRDQGPYLVHSHHLVKIPRQVQQQGLLEFVTVRTSPLGSDHPVPSSAEGMVDLCRETIHLL